MIPLNLSSRNISIDQHYCCGICHLFTLHRESKNGATL